MIPLNIVRYDLEPALDVHGDQLAITEAIESLQAVGDVEFEALADFHLREDYDFAELVNQDQVSLGRVGEE